MRSAGLTGISGPSNRVKRNPPDDRQTSIKHQLDEDAVDRTVSVHSVFDFNTSPRRMLAGASGPILLGLGSGISISAGFGAFGFSVLLDGLHSTFHLPLWLSQTLMTLTCYLIAWYWGRIPLGMGTFPALLLIGPAVSLGAYITPDNLALTGNLIAFVIGFLGFSFGITLAAAAALGPDGVTALSLAAERMKSWPVPRATFLWNLSAITAGLILGGNLGAATLVGLIGTPVVIHMTLPTLRTIIHQRQHG